MMNHTLTDNDSVSVTGGKIHYRVYEPHDPALAARAPVVLIHGGPGGSDDILYDALSDIANDRPLVVYDQLGSFRSPAALGDELYPVARFVDELDGLLTHLKRPAAILLGHSWGGAIAASYALAHPASVAGLVLSCPLLSTERWLADCKILLSAFPEEMQKTVETCEANGTTESPEYKEADRVFSQSHFMRTSDHRTLWEKHRHKGNRALYLAMWGASEFTCSGTLRDFDIFDRLGEIQAPTLLLCGQYDTARPETMEAVQKKIAGSTLAVMPNAGHCAYLDANQPYIQAVRDFLAAHKL